MATTNRRRKISRGLGLSHQTAGIDTVSRPLAEESKAIARARRGEGG